MGLRHQKEGEVVKAMANGRDVIVICRNRLRRYVMAVSSISQYSAVFC